MWANSRMCYFACATGVQFMDIMAGYRTLARARLDNLLRYRSLFKKCLLVSVTLLYILEY